MTTTQALVAQVPQLLASGDRRGLARVVTQLIDMGAPLTSAWKSLSRPLLDFGELDLACRAIDRFAQIDGSAAAQFDRAVTYVRCGRAKEAISIIEGIDRRQPDVVSNAYLRGTIALNLGQRTVARSALLDAWAAQPNSGQILQTLAMLGSLRADDEIAALIHKAAGPMRFASQADRGSYLYALGKMHDDLGDTDAAFSAFAEGAAIIARQRPYDAGWDRKSAAAAKAGWTRKRIDTIGAKLTIGSDRLILVTGLPRSGSTLVEQILTSHSAVSDGDEVGCFSIVANEIGGTSFADYDAWSRNHEPDEASKSYLHLLAQRFGNQGRIVDKTLEASRYLGLLAAIMPDAPILWMRRDPIDNAWSCFSTYFLVGLPWSWSLTSIAEHMVLEEHLLNHWQDVLGNRLRVIDYEHLVSSKDEHIPDIIQHAKLPMEAATLAPEVNSRLVTTASVSQVRSPINTRAVGRSEPYATHLRPFIEHYQELIHST